MGFLVSPLPWPTSLSANGLSSFFCLRKPREKRPGSRYWSKNAVIRLEIETDVHVISRHRFLEKTVHACWQSQNILFAGWDSTVLVEILLLQTEKKCVQPLFFLVTVCCWQAFCCWLKVLQSPRFGCLTWQLQWVESTFWVDNPACFYIPLSCLNHICKYHFF